MFQVPFSALMRSFLFPVFTVCAMAFPYVGVLLAIKFAVYMFEIYLNIRQYTAMEVPYLPKPLEGVVNEQRFTMSQYYCLDKSEICIMHKTIKVLTEMAVLYFGVMRFLWEKSEDFIVYYKFNMENGIVKETIQTLIFLTILMSLFEIIELPFSLYETFVINTRHGLINKTFQQFISCWYQKIGNHIFVAPLSVFAIIVTVQNGGPQLVVYLWILTLIASILVMTLYPILVVLLFSTSSVLPPGALRVKIENLALSFNFPLKQIIVIDESIQMDHCNLQAYVYGIFNNMQIAVSNKLIKQFKNSDEVVAAIAHVLGHWKLNHTLYSFIALQAFMFLQFGGYMLVRNSRDVLQCFGFETRPIMIEVIIFEQIANPFQKLWNFALNRVRHLFELQADAFVMNLGYAAALRSYIVKLQENTMSVTNIDALFSTCCLSQPKFVERLAAIDDYTCADKRTD